MVDLPGVGINFGGNVALHWYTPAHGSSPPASPLRLNEQRASASTSSPERGRFMFNQSTSRIRSLGALLTLLVIALLAGTLLAKGAFPAGTYAAGDFTVTFRSDG